MKFIILYISQIIVIYHSYVLGADKIEKQLIKKLLGNYDRRVRPGLNSSTPLNVTFGLSLAQLIDVDEKNQIVTTNCWLNQAWLDPELAWNPKEFEGIETLLLPYDSIWLPDILLYNNADVASSKTSSVSTNVIISYTGNVTWLSTVIYRSSCTIDVRFFPFDTQNCSMLFASWTYDGSQINLMLVDTEGDLSNYVPSRAALLQSGGFIAAEDCKHCEFELKKMQVFRHSVYYSCCPHPYPDITYYIHMKRRPMFYVFNMLLPCFLITLVALLGFYIPSDSGEKVTMGITTLLSMTVFLMLVTEAMPPTSDHLPLIGVYYFLTIAIVSLATAMTVCTLNIHHKGTRGKLVPPWIQFVCFKILAKLFCIPIEYPDPEILNEVPLSHKNSRPPKCRSNESNGWKKKNQQPRFQNGAIELQEQLIHESSSTQKLHEDYCMETREAPAHKSAIKNGHLHHGREGPSGAVDEALYNNLSERPTEKPWKQIVSGRTIEQRPEEKLDAHFTKVLQSISASIAQNEMRLVEQDRRDAVKLQWQQVAVVVDRLLLLLFVSLTIGITLGLTLSGVVDV